MIVPVMIGIIGVQTAAIAWAVHRARLRAIDKIKEFERRDKPKHRPLKPRRKPQH